MRPNGRWPRRSANSVVGQFGRLSQFRCKCQNQGPRFCHSRASGNLRIGCFSGSPPEIRRGCAAQRHGGGLRDAPRTVIQAFRIEEEPLRQETFDWRFPQGAVAPPRRWLRHRPPLLSRGGESKCPISRFPRKRESSGPSGSWTACCSGTRLQLIQRLKMKFVQETIPN
jgi:hypothetical protein